MYDSHNHDIGSASKLNSFYVGDKRLLIASHYITGKHIYDVQHWAVVIVSI